jgi:hypothetical protein
MAAAIAQAQEISKAARIKAFDIAAPANVQRRHFRMIRAKRFGKSSPTPPVTYVLLYTLISLLFTYAPPPHPPASLPSLPPARSDSPQQFQAYFPIFLYPYPPTLLHPYPPAPK